MKKKIIALFLLVCFMLSLAGCIKPGDESKAPADPTPKPLSSYEVTDPIVPYEKITQITWLRVADEPLSTAALEFILLNFGLKVNEKNFTSQNMTEKIEKLYQSSQIPDITTGISVGTAKRLAEAGCFEELTQREELKDYFSLWNGLESGWEYTKAEITSEGKLFCLVPVNRKASKAWIYNKSYFEANELEFPKTVEELFDLLTAYKKADSQAGAMWLNKYEPMQFTALLNAYGLTDDEWQTDENGNVFYLYSDKRWYEACEWMSRFEKAGFVPTDKNGSLKALTDSEYETATHKRQQILEYTDSYNYLIVQGKQSGYDKWAVAENMIVADESVTPAMKANVPYINEATCVSAKASDELKERILKFLDWLCTEDGNMWANFGRKGVGYDIDENGNFVFLKYYSAEVTPDIDKEKAGSISELSTGRMFTTALWDKINFEGRGNRYSAEEAFLATANIRLVLPERFLRGEGVTEDATELHGYDVMIKNIRKLTADFEASMKKNGFSDVLWEKYRKSLDDAGLNEYTAYMQKRKY